MAKAKVKSAWAAMLFYFAHSRCEFCEKSQYGCVFACRAQRNKGFYPNVRLYFLPCISIIRAVFAIANLHFSTISLREDGFALWLIQMFCCLLCAFALSRKEGL